MKKPAFFIVALAVATSILAPSNASADTEGPYTYTVAEGQATITDFSTSYSGALSITNELGGYPVTSIGDSAFRDCASLTSVTIPDSVTTIRGAAFSYCTSLVSVTIPYGVTTIRGAAFSYCTSLVSVTIPDSVTTIGIYAFACCTSLTSVTIGSGVTDIGYSAFFDCTSLTSVTLHNNLSGFKALDVFYSPIATVVIGDEVTTIGDEAFAYCNTLTSLTIGRGVTDIGYSAFSGCTSLTSVTVPDSVTDIGYSAFCDCTSLTSVMIGSGVTTIADRAFYRCSALTWAFFAGNAPTPGSSVFSGTQATVYYLPDATGWGDTYAGRPTATWLLSPLVTFDPQGGVAPSPETNSVTFGGTYGTLATTSRTGYTFEGWWTEPGGSGLKISPTTTVSITANQTLYANWTPNTYLVTFDSQSGTAPLPESKIVTFSDTYGTLASTSRAGYTFEGWWTGIGGSGTEVASSSPVTITSPQTLYAQWKTDAFDVQNGLVSEPIWKTSAVNPSTENSGAGGASVKLGGIGKLGHGEKAGLEWSVTGPGFLGFDWKVSSEQDWDVLRFYEVGVGETNQISGTGQGWIRVSIEVSGDAVTSHTFRWEYEKDPIGDYVGDDAGWVDAITWTPKFILTIEDGNGDGWYTNRSPVAISADASAPHYEFDRWAGDTNGVADIFSDVTTLTMPFTNVVLTATYKPILYPLTVVNGSGSGEYLYRSTVEITAPQLTGKQFYRWTGDVEAVASPASSATTLTMPDVPTVVVATYSVPLTVNDGSGSGWHPEGSAVTVTADPDPLYMEFAGWTGDAAAFLEDASSSTTTLTMPTAPSTLTATYRDSIARVSGSYGRTYTRSGTATGISTDAAAGAPSGNAAVKLGGTGIVPDNGFTAFETVVHGSGSITFWWKSSSEVNDYLRFLVDGVQVAAISGTKSPWTWVSNRVEGAYAEHTLRWEYAKNDSLTSTSDAAWVDDIVWIGDVPMPVVAPDFHSTTANDSGFKFTFWGERGIPYFVYTKTSLNAPDWQPVEATFQEIGEENGAFLYEASVVMVPEQTVGFYRVSTPPIIPIIPCGMVLIPGGTNSGTDPDFGAYSLTVDSFYMDATEVTKAKWDEVYTWAIINGYSFDHAGSGKAANHPVHTVSWYDVVKWCNARSQKEGRTPCYTVSGNVYKTGQSAPACNVAANGYRLPTNVEWEYAARGGLSGKRFPWGDTIQHSRANYSSSSSYSYDTSPTRGSHPTYATGGSPYTSPAGAFAPNGYGLYDMAGNVWEWCNDSSGSIRAFRGGSWIYGANYARCRSSMWDDPGDAFYYHGFRAVCR